MWITLVDSCPATIWPDREHLVDRDRKPWPGEDWKVKLEEAAVSMPMT